MVSRLLTYVSGRWLPKLEATVSASDASFLYGFGVHDSARTYAGRLHEAKLEEHVSRLLESARLLRLEPPFDREVSCETGAQPSSRLARSRAETTPAL